MAFTNPHPIELEIWERRESGQSYREISVALGIPEGTIAGRLARLRAQKEGRLQPSFTGFGEALRHQRLTGEATRRRLKKLGIAIVEP